MQLEQTLTKENFFNNLKELYPKSVDNFCKWIDEYKKAVDWDNLFRLDKHEDPMIKFHDIPYAMQYGIWIEYCRQTLGNYFEQPEHISDFVDLETDITECFKELEPLINEDE